MLSYRPIRFWFKQFLACDHLLIFVERSKYMDFSVPINGFLIYFYYMLQLFSLNQFVVTVCFPLDHDSFITFRWVFFFFCNVDHDCCSHISSYSFILDTEKSVEIYCFVCGESIRYTIWGSSLYVMSLQYRLLKQIF